MLRRLTLVTAVATLAAAVPAGAQVAAPPAPPLAPPPSIAPEALERIYRGDDGSAYYQRVVGTTVVGFGEHPGRDYAFAFHGTLSADGMTITGTSWDVAKGSRPNAGAVAFAASNGGAHLAVTSGGPIGPVAYDAVPAESVPWTGARPAGFQSISATDLDGAFDGNDASRTYVRETGGSVVWVTEAAAGSGQRPAWTSVFIGKRAANGGISGDWWDVPKGTRALSGYFGAASVSNQRKTYISQYASGGAGNWDRILEPDYRVDLDEMSATLKSAFDGRVMGYGWAIVKDGKVVREGANGQRQVRARTFIGFTPKTENDGGSTGKLVTAAMVVRALELRHKSVDSRVYPYLPKSWKRGVGIGTLTFRQLLDHSANLFYAGKTTCSDNPYDCLKQAFEQGRTRKIKQPASPGDYYHNIHYTAMRVVLPFLVEKSKMTKLFATEKNTKKLNAGFSKVFRDYTVTVLRNAGVTADFKYVTNDNAHWFNFATKKRYDLPADDSYLKAGSGSLRASAHEYAEFLAALDKGTIVSAKGYAAMKSGYLGFDIKGAPGKLTGGLGEYWRKNGGCGGCGSQLIVLPDHVAVYFTYNSDKNTFSNRERILRDAYVNALD
jgi:hypothetical protein